MNRTPKKHMFGQKDIVSLVWRWRIDRQNWSISAICGHDETSKNKQKKQPCSRKLSIDETTHVIRSKCRLAWCGGWFWGYSYKFQVSSKLAVRFASCVGSKIALSNCTTVHAVMALDIMADTVKRWLIAYQMAGCFCLAWLCSVHAVDLLRVTDSVSITRW